MAKKVLIYLYKCTEWTVNENGSSRINKTLVEMTESNQV